jgi:hypothetical protein
MKKMKSVLYENIVMKKFEGWTWYNSSDVGNFNSLNCGLYSMNVILGRMMELAYECVVKFEFDVQEVVERRIPMDE